MNQLSHLLQWLATEHRNARVRKAGDCGTLFPVSARILSRRRPPDATAVATTLHQLVSPIFRLQTTLPYVTGIDREPRVVLM